MKKMVKASQIKASPACGGAGTGNGQAPTDAYEGHIKGFVPYVEITPEMAKGIIDRAGILDEGDYRRDVRAKHAKEAANIAERIRKGTADRTLYLVKIDASGNIISGIEAVLAVWAAGMPCEMKIEDGAVMDLTLGMGPRATLAENADFMSRKYGGEDFEWKSLIPPMNALIPFLEDAPLPGGVVEAIKRHPGIAEGMGEYFEPSPVISRADIRAAAIIYLVNARSQEEKDGLRLWCRYVGKGSSEEGLPASAMKLISTTRPNLIGRVGEFACMKGRGADARREAVVRAYMSMHKFGCGGRRIKGRAGIVTYEGAEAVVRNTAGFLFGVGDAASESVPRTTGKDVLDMVRSARKEKKDALKAEAKAKKKDGGDGRD